MTDPTTPAPMDSGALTVLDPQMFVTFKEPLLTRRATVSDHVPPQWRDAEGAGASDLPPAADFAEAGQWLEGVFTAHDSVRIGDRLSRRYYFTVTDPDTGERLDVMVWGSAGLDAMMDWNLRRGLRPGCKTLVIFEGLGEAKPGQNPPKQWVVRWFRPGQSRVRGPQAAS